MTAGTNPVPPGNTADFTVTVTNKGENIANAAEIQTTTAGWRGDDGRELDVQWHGGRGVPERHDLGHGCAAAACRSAGGRHADV